MPCYSPQLAVPQRGLTRNGKTPLKFVGCIHNQAIRYAYQDKLKSRDFTARILPCRQCIGCRLEKSRQWATRLLHEANLHEKACFLTLTYDDNFVPNNGSLNPYELTTFFKDLRARMDYYGKEKIKYFAVGEYGEEKGRPHYHAALFGPFDTHCHDPGRNEERPSRSGDRQFSHADIDACWGKGDAFYSELTFESAAYVARYCLKKISGVSAPSHYGDLVPEFQRCSKGIGKGHLLHPDQSLNWLSDVYPSDHVVIPGRGAFLPPPYYDRLLEKVDPSLYSRVKKAREEAREKMSVGDFLEFANERDREGRVRTLVTEQTLIRGIE